MSPTPPNGTMVPISRPVPFLRRTRHAERLTVIVRVSQRRYEIERVARFPRQSAGICTARSGKRRRVVIEIHPSGELQARIYRNGAPQSGCACERPAAVIVYGLAQIERAGKGRAAQVRGGRIEMQ